MSNAYVTDHALASRLEYAEAKANVASIEARDAADPQVGAKWIEVDGTFALFDGPGSPLTQSFGLGMAGAPTHGARVGCDLAMMVASPGGGSQRNAERRARAPRVEHPAAWLELFRGVVALPRIMDSTDRAYQQTQEEFRAELLRWLPNVSRFARLLTRHDDDADDLTQETILRACANWETFRAGSDCRRWLFAICRNSFLRDQERSTRVVAVDDPEADVGRVADLYWEAASRGIEGLFDRIDLAPALERSLRELVPEYREVVVLVDIEDYTYADAADALGVPIGTVRSRLYRARRMLQETLLEHARDFGFGGAKTDSARSPGDEARILS
jgi:RNA polymerase sigma-70 factor (ECF subfamily)